MHKKNDEEGEQRSQIGERGQKNGGAHKEREKHSERKRDKTPKAKGDGEGKR